MITTQIHSRANFGKSTRKLVEATSISVEAGEPPKSTWMTHRQPDIYAVWQSDILTVWESYRLMVWKSDSQQSVNLTLRLCESLKSWKAVSLLVWQSYSHIVLHTDSLTVRKSDSLTVWKSYTLSGWQYDSLIVQLSGIWQSNSHTVWKSDSLTVRKNLQSDSMTLLQYDCLTFKHSNRMTVWLPNSITVWLWKSNNLKVSTHQQPLDPKPQLAGHLILVGDSPGVFQGGQEVQQTDRQTEKHTDRRKK